ncbi:thiamine pyrophosphokinase [Lactococcus hodotermopsidis]|uniref:Thiamine diphosphokinase n=1 Tax=Pseudolactococcus hodotermopsidis TaxID=2709157 RepID=A0A6A0BCX1_9LACT|nr:thiamine diphosphokinase [Lactococcus hodotermopsidis]GFH43252.1 thiamine pyrophosphokinase [Lactococcus hodotermopsidis]
MKIIIVAGGPAENFEALIADNMKKSDTFFVGVDRGAYRLMSASLPLDMAVGDFDSLTVEELSEVKVYAKSFQQSPAEKADTDLELGVLLATERFPNASEILILGGLGGRFDHEIQILYLVLQTRFAHLVEKIILLNPSNMISFKRAGRHILTKIPEMTYLAFASLTPVTDFFIQNARYDLAKTNFPQNFSFSSNEFLADKPVTIGFTKGIVVVIQAKD